jgi:hypothetical protein
MKKTTIILILLLVMVSSVTAGTLAMYTTSIDDLAQGSVVAKEFVFTGEGTDSFAQGVKIAPTETVNWQFDVKNYSGHMITETDLYYKLTVNVHATSGKKAIAPLRVTIKDESGKTVGSTTGVGKFDILGEFPLSQTGQDETYTVELNWPSNDSVDIDYAGDAYGTTVNIDAIASQAPLSSSEPEQETGKISVLYQTTKSWQNGQSGINEYNYSVTITNHSDAPINSWYIGFTLHTDRLTNAWSNAKMVQGLAEGTYRFNNPAYNNTATDNILPGQSVTFGGHGYGLGTDAPKSAKVGGSNADAKSAVITCKFGSLS